MPVLTQARLWERFSFFCFMISVYYALWFHVTLITLRLIQCVCVCVSQADWLVWCNCVLARCDPLLLQRQDGSRSFFVCVCVCVVGGGNAHNRIQSYPSLLLRRTSNPLPLQRLYKQLFKKRPTTQSHLTLHYHTRRTASLHVPGTCILQMWTLLPVDIAGDSIIIQTHHTPLFALGRRRKKKPR